MKVQTISYLIVLLAWTSINDMAVALTCETTLAANDPNQKYSDQVYLADCRIETHKSSPFKILPGDHAIFTAEQQIRLGPGFHAQKGSLLQTRFRDCIRNPDENTGYASRGSTVRWMKPIVDTFVANFNTPPLTVELKFRPGTRNIGAFYKDATLATDGKDHSVPDEPHGGIDEGVFHFHLGHGAPESFDVRVGDELVLHDGTISYWGTAESLDYQQNMMLGNCNCDGNDCKVGELRYLWMCSCRVFAHGPRVVAGYRVFDEDLIVERMDPDTGSITVTKGGYVWKERDEYDRPSEFDGSADSLEHRNVIERWSTVLSNNVRMACGVSTRAHCGNVDDVVASLKRNYFEEGMSVADSWGHAVAGDYTKGTLLDLGGNVNRVVHVTPLCIARGNANTRDPKSPITDDQRFTHKANPYEETFHVVSWEWDDARETSVAKEQVMPETLPVFVSASAKWLNDERHVKEQMPPGDFYTHEGMLISKDRTTDGRPKVKIDTRTGAIILAGEREALRKDRMSKVLSLEEYASAAKDFIERQGWSESDMDAMEVVRAMLQIIPLDSQIDPSRIIKMQKDITFYVGRRIPLETVSPRVFGSDNLIVVQMNNDGTVTRASKRWKEITEKVEGVPLKSYEEAYAEAINQLGNPGLYEMSNWDWGYKSTTDDSVLDMLVVYYSFTFDPIAAVDACITQPIIIEIQGHIL